MFIALGHNSSLAFVKDQVLAHYFLINFFFLCSLWSFLILEIKKLFINKSLKKVVLGLEKISYGLFYGLLKTMQKQTVKCTALTKYILLTTYKKLFLKLEDLLVSTSKFKRLLEIEIHHKVFINPHV